MYYLNKIASDKKKKHTAGILAGCGGVGIGHAIMMDSILRKMKMSGDCRLVQALSSLVPSAGALYLAHKNWDKNS